MGTTVYPSLIRQSRMAGRASGVCSAALWNSTMLPAVPWRSPAGRWCPRHNPSSRGNPIGKDLKPLRRKGFHNMTSSIKITRRMQGLNRQAIKKSGAGTDGIVFQKLPRKLPHRTHNESSESTCGAAPKRKPSCRGGQTADRSERHFMTAEARSVPHSSAR